MAGISIGQSHNESPAAAFCRKAFFGIHGSLPPWLLGYLSKCNKLKDAVPEA